MNLLYCAGCRHAFTAPDATEPEAWSCVVCGRFLRVVARDAVQVSPLMGRDEHPAVAVPAEVAITSVALRRRRSADGGAPILCRLAEYFQVVATDGGAQVCVDRGAPSDAAWRVAAILDGIDNGWEAHFFLPELAEGDARV